MGDPPQQGSQRPDGAGQAKEIQVGNLTFKASKQVFDGFNALPDALTYTRLPIKAFTRPEGGTHYYETVLMTSRNISWLQAAVLAQSEGGYLASVTSARENAFIYKQVNSAKFFWELPDGLTNASPLIGPFLGGIKQGQSEDVNSGWSWVSGERWSFDNWAANWIQTEDKQDKTDSSRQTSSSQNGRQGPGRQGGKGGRGPSRDGQDQRQSPSESTSYVAMSFAGLNKPSSQWGALVSGRGSSIRAPIAYSRAFIIEYDKKPK
ncbi:hypothetical protein [Cohaesibacter celericrescens]|jgi:hypothetical protein|uniref:C-type lectin domain-containing protein n=1 Tax=Cohaesibacter celericrescens TaxID=2067669 RepID=A0A2N5XQU4_9HYPH|nr:hypothetical protein [Cohaesibacter celericrescens]PLW76873.1 hypothetical protein C0081_12505 [Cohaesibacter celericrescens]